MTEQQAIDLGYAEGIKSFEYLHTQIMGGFDFEKVQKTMEFLKWKWGTLSEAHVPSVNELKEEATRLLDKAYSSKGSVSTGGFTATWEDNEMFLEFTIEWYEAY